MFNFIRNCQMFLQNVPTMYESSWSTFVFNFLEFFILAMWVCIYGISLCISLVPNDVEHLLVCLLAIYIFSFVKGLLKSFCIPSSFRLAGLPFYY